MSFLSTVKQAANAALLPLGHRIDFHAIIPQTGWLIQHLERADLTPATVFDVGVADGTPWMYRAWPQAKFHLFDPTPQSLPHMRRWAKTLKAKVYNYALGDEPGSLDLRVRREHSGSSFFDEIGKADLVETIRVPVVRFDAAINVVPRPALIKIDVQGAELMVLRGMGERLADMDCIIVETGLIATLDGSPEFADVVDFMTQAGFVLFDIVGVLRRPLDHAVAYVDAVFVPASSPLRQDRRWGTGSY